MDGMHRVLHGLAIKKYAGASEIASVAALDTAEADKLLAVAVASGRAEMTNGRFVLTPLARVALEASYSGHYADLRNDSAFMASYEAFEVINRQLKTIITDWQTLQVSDQRVANDHSNQDHDQKVLDRLSICHERISRILIALERGLSRLSHYRHLLLAALEKAEDGMIEWVSDVRIESYHTVWFELHEDLLRIVGRTRRE